MVPSRHNSIQQALDLIHWVPTGLQIERDMHRIARITQRFHRPEFQLPFPYPQNPRRVAPQDLFLRLFLERQPTDQLDIAPDVRHPRPVGAKDDLVRQATPKAGEDVKERSTSPRTLVAKRWSLATGSSLESPLL